MVLKLLRMNLIVEIIGIKSISQLFLKFSKLSIKYYFCPMTSYSSLPPSRTSSRSKKPSNYAKYIQEYQQQIVPKSTKKLKSDIELSNDIPNSSLQQKKGKKFIPCILPDGKRLNLEILFSKSNQFRPKPQLIKQKVTQPSISTEKKSKPEENNLLSKFLFAFQQIQKNEKEVENESNKNTPNSAELHINQTKKEPKEIKKKEKDEDDKLTKYYDKIKKLDQKFLQISQTLIFL